MKKKNCSNDLTAEKKIRFNDIDRETALKAVDLFHCLFNFDYLTFDFEDKELYRAAKKLKAKMNLKLNKKETKNLLEFIMHGMYFEFASENIDEEALDDLCARHWNPDLMNGYQL